MNQCAFFLIISPVLLQKLQEWIDRSNLFAWLVQEQGGC